MTQVQGQGGKKKGLGVLAWIAIGCAVLVVLVGVGLLAGGYFVARKAKSFVERFEENPVLAAAEAYARLNPEVDVVDSDPEAQTVTLRNNETGEEVTVNLEQIKEGRISFRAEGKEVEVGLDEESGFAYRATDESGEVTQRIGRRPEGAPDWIPIYPGATASDTYVMERPEAVNGGLTLETEDGFDEVVAFYRGKLEEAGYSVETQLFSQGSGSIQTLSGKDEAKGRELGATISSQEGVTRVLLTFQALTAR